MKTKKAKSEIKQALQESEMRRAEVVVLLEGISAIHQHHEFTDAARAIFNSCKDIIGADAGCILLSKNDQKDERLFYDSGGRVCTVNKDLPMPVQGLRREAYDSGKTLYENDYPHSKYEKLIPSGHVTLDNVLFAPFKANGKVVGLLGLGNKPGEFNDNDARRATTFAEHAALALYNSRNHEALEESMAHYHSVVETATDAIITIDSNKNIIFWNQAAERIFGYTAREITSNSLTTIMPERFRDAHVTGLERTLKYEDVKLKRRLLEVVGLRKNGEEFPMELSVAKWTTKKGIFITGIIRDITERNRAEERITRFSRIFEDSLNEIYLFDADSLKFVQVNNAAQRNLGYTMEELQDLTPIDLKPEFTSELLAELIAPLRKGEKEKVVFETVHKRKDKSLYNVEVHLQLIKHEHEKLFTAIILDITKRKQLEQQLQQAQKMEAVGQLTGGVAHDFNNILAIIQGNLELLKDRLKDDAKGTHHLKKATFNVKRGAQLTQRLLAFSREQLLEPAPLDLNDLIRGMHDLLQRTLGEAIEIETICAGGLWRSFADHAQVENVLLNLTINARDAMPGGGKLTIETANTRLDDNYAATHAEVVAGQYVMLAVSDTGKGMSEEVLAHVFEPFYTTKAVGKGSGLGMSMVYGFARQSGGYITIYSEVGEGTTIKLYLPRDTGSNEAEEKGAITGDTPIGQQETVLVVEDEPDLLEIVVTQLESLGYTVISARGGTTALEIVEKNEGIDLLLTDVILSGDMNGPDIAKALQKQRPVIKVLYMSGYTEDAMIHEGRMEGDVQLLRKPFTRDELSRKIRERLDS